MKRLVKALLLSTVATVPAAGFAQAAATTQAGCKLRIDSSAGNWIIDGYDPFGGAPAANSFDAVFVNEGDGECRFRPFFATDAAAFGLEADGGGRVRYTLYDTLGRYDATPLGGRTVQRVTNPPVVIGPRGQQLVRYRLSVEAGDVPGDGLFAQRVFLQAEDVGGAPVTQRQLTLGLRVAPAASLALAGAFTRSEGRVNVDLGELVEGVPQVPLRLQVRSTRAYRIGVSSLNGGRLRLGTTGWAVPYRIAINGRQVAMNSDDAYLSGTQPGLRVESLPIAFSIGDPARHRAGVYSDVVTVTVAAL